MSDDDGISGTIIVSDFDETFSVGLEKNIEEAKKFMAEGNLFIIATGSSYQSYMKKLHGINFNASYIFSNHGALMTKDSKILYENCISKDIANNIYTEIMNKNYKSYFYCSKDVEMFSEVLDNTEKININLYTEEDAINFKKELLEKYGEHIHCYLMYGTMIEIVSKQASKIAAINKILELEHINKNNVYAVGDGYSDVEMIKEYNGYSMKESIPELKDIAIKDVNNVSELIDELL